MHCLIFDTETTGLPVNNPSTNETSKWPFVIQLSYIVLNVKTNSIVSFQNDYIKIPNHVKIDEKALSVHGITKEYLNENGINIRKALFKFRRYLNLCKIVVGHNIMFDKKMMMVEFNRNNMMH